MTKLKCSWLCKIGLHKFETITETIGYVDCGESILKEEKSWIGCVRKGCNAIKTPKKGNFIKFKKEEKE